MRSRTSSAAIRKLIAILLAAALLLAPALTRVGIASAAEPHHAQMMEQTGHCHEPPSLPADSDKSAGKNCCISMCLAVTVDAATPPDNQPVQRVISIFPVTAFRIAFLGEIATPPPRLL